MEEQSKESLDTEAQKARVEANKAAEADPLESEEVQIAAGYYAKLCKTIKGYSGNMKAGGLGRVMVALAEFPYGEKYPKFRSDAEQQLFTFMLTIQSAKAKIAEALKPELEKLSNAAVDGIVQEKMEQIKGDVNGSKMD